MRVQAIATYAHLSIQKDNFFVQVRLPCILEPELQSQQVACPCACKPISYLFVCLHKANFISTCTYLHTQWEMDLHSYFMRVLEMEEMNKPLTGNQVGCSKIGKMTTK